MRMILVEYEGAEVDSTRIDVPAELMQEFKEVIKRGTQFATQTSPRMKIFVDTLLDRPWMEKSYMREVPESYRPVTAQVVEN